MILATNSNKTAAIHLAPTQICGFGLETKGAQEWKIAPGSFEDAKTFAAKHGISHYLLAK
jgi:hypothetical protein